MTEFAWLGLHIAEHWKGLIEIYATGISAATFAMWLRPGLARLLRK